MHVQLQHSDWSGLIQEMKKENASLAVYWTVAFYLALSTICVTANKLYPKSSDVEDVIAREDDVAVENNLIYGVGPTDSDQPAVERSEMAHKEENEICQIAYLRCSAYNNNQNNNSNNNDNNNNKNKNNNNNNILPASPTLFQNNLIALITGTADYRLSFDIVPTGIISSPASILHFASSNECCPFGIRSPAFFFAPGSTQLDVRIDDSKDDHWGLKTVELPLNVRTKVTLECKGKDVKLTVGEKVYTAMQPTYRYAGKLFVYAGHPSIPTAKAVISNLDYKALPAARANAAVTSQRRYKYKI